MLLLFGAASVASLTMIQVLLSLSVYKEDLYQNVEDKSMVFIEEISSKSQADFEPRTFKMLRACLDLYTLHLLIEQYHLP